MTESCLHLNWEEINNYHSHCFSCALIGWEVHVPDKKLLIIVLQEVGLATSH